MHYGLKYLSDFVQANAKRPFSSLSSENLITNDFSDLTDNFILDIRKLYRDLRCSCHLYHLLRNCFYFTRFSFLFLSLTHILYFVFAVICIYFLYCIYSHSLYSLIIPHYILHASFPLLLFTKSLYCLIAVTCFLPGQAKDLSAPR